MENCVFSMSSFHYDLGHVENKQDKAWPLLLFVTKRNCVAASFFLHLFALFFVELCALLNRIPTRIKIC